MEKWTRFFYQPCLPLGKTGARVTGSQEHIDLSRKAAAEGMVLLKNEKEFLPFSKGQKLAVFGKACVDYVKGGGGSGDVTVAYTRNLMEGLKIKEQEGKVQIFWPAAEYYEKAVKKQYEEGYCPGMTVEPQVSEELLREGRAFTDTALVTICRYSGEGWDRKSILDTTPDAGEEDLARLSARLFENGDFCLTEAEKEMVAKVKSVFPNVAVVLNTGGMMDTSWFKDDPGISAVLLAWQGGMEGGLAAADILCGDVNPSGKLAETWPLRLEDNPSYLNFPGEDGVVEYREGIFIGYRYYDMDKVLRAALDMAEQELS